MNKVDGYSNLATTEVALIIDNEYDLYVKKSELFDDCIEYEEKFVWSDVLKLLQNNAKYHKDLRRLLNNYVGSKKGDENFIFFKEIADQWNVELKEKEESEPSDKELLDEFLDEIFEEENEIDIMAETKEFIEGLLITNDSMLNRWSGDTN